MARLDVYEALRPGIGGYVLDVQADRLDHLKSPVLVPLLPRVESLPPICDLNPVFDINGQLHVMATQFIFVASTQELGTRITSLDAMHDVIRNALDFLCGSY